ncbi:hypothetical protein NDU88_000447 [Pleurodeles waltl]|uniref:Uncharacterized protein n=1 Tax=Pleurodeles waltl TaxID=8319 RepID=A0AAV7L6Z5_PLEWA|nr:hypothetical protein NDU88_000447 [Pleurodeles waltl]
MRLQCSRCALLSLLAVCTLGKYRGACSALTVHFYPNLQCVPLPNLQYVLGEYWGACRALAVDFYLNLQCILGVDSGGACKDKKNTEGFLPPPLTPPISYISNMAYYANDDEQYQELQEMPLEHQMEEKLVEALGHRVQDLNL